MQSLRIGDLMALAGGGLDSLALDYGDPRGAAALRQAIGGASGIDADCVVTFPGTMLGLFLLADQLGGEAVLVTPCFGPARDALERARVPIRQVRLRFEDDYRLDVDRIARKLHRATRIVCLADPQNPSGVRLRREAIQALLDAMTRRAPKALLFLDETYREATYGEAAPPSAAGLDLRIVTAASLSKAYGAPGLRIGWLTIPDAALRARMVTGKQALVICGSVLDEALAAVLMRSAVALLDRRRRALGSALEAVVRWQLGEPGLEMVRPQAGALCCLRLDPRHIGRDGVRRFWAALPTEHLRLAPGPWFGETRRVFRLGFGHLPLAELRAALPALSRAVAVAG